MHPQCNGSGRSYQLLTLRIGASFAHLNGFTGPLGSRWFSSTKTTFVDSVAAVCANGVYLDQSTNTLAMSAITLLVFIALTVLLLTHPTERL